MHYDIEFYKEDGTFCAYIGQEDGSGYKIISDSIDGLTQEIGSYFGDVVEEKDFN
jgi:hypothetical protein